jgi:hypothetical protein
VRRLPLVLSLLAVLGVPTTVVVAAVAFAQETCQPGPKDPAGIYVDLADDRNAATIRHVRDAVARGQPRVLHWDPADADARRDASLRGFPVWSRLPVARRQAIDPDRWELAHDRDEYPPAASAEGGAGADVAYILSADNRSSGSRMRTQMSAYCARTRFALEP